MDEARAPLIAKKLEDYKPKFEAENKDLSQKDKEAEWQKIHDAAYAST